MAMHTPSMSYTILGQKGKKVTLIHCRALNHTLALDLKDERLQGHLVLTKLHDSSKVHPFPSIKIINMDYNV